MCVCVCVCAGVPMASPLLSLQPAILSEQKLQPIMQTCRGLVSKKRKVRACYLVECVVCGLHPGARVIEWQAPLAMAAWK